MAKLTVIFGPQASGKSSSVEVLTRNFGQKRFRTIFYSYEEPIVESELLLRKPECVIVDECPLESLDYFVKLVNHSKINIKGTSKTIHDINTPEFYVIINNCVEPGQVLEIAGGRNIKMIECRKRMEVNNG